MIAGRLRPYLFDGSTAILDRHPPSQIADLTHARSVRAPDQAVRPEIGQAMAMTAKQPPEDRLASWRQALSSINRDSAVLPILAIFTATRLAMLAIALIAATQIAVHEDVLHNGWSNLACRWDCIWYLSVAQKGYSPLAFEVDPNQTNFAFFPLYPLLVRWVTPLFAGDTMVAAIALSNACAFAALLYVFRYARMVGLDRGAALLAVALLCSLPQSFTLSVVLSEGLFLMLLAAATYHLRAGHYLAAGIAAALLSATRAPGILFVLLAGLWLVERVGFANLLRPWRNPELLVPLALAPLGLFAFWAYCFATTGDAFAQVSTARHGWDWAFSPPWINLPVMFHSGGIPLLVATSGLLALACSLLLLRMKLVPEFTYCACAIALVLSGEGTSSVFRYWLVLFPIWVAVARMLAGRPLTSALVFSVAGLANAVMVCAWTLKDVISL